MSQDIERHLMNILSWANQAQEDAIRHLSDLRDLKVGPGPRLTKALQSLSPPAIAVSEAQQALTKIWAEPPQLADLDNESA